jgi:SAM-dependent methyltransferase
MDFTGERVIPGLIELTPLFEEHLARYFFAGNFVQDQQVLDLGCGTGYGSYYLSQRGASFVLGTDIDEASVRYARRHYKAPNLAYCQSDALQLPSCSQRFNVVVSFEVIEHLEAKSYLAEISRIMTSKGWLIGSTPNRLVYSMGAKKSHNPFHQQEYDPVELKALLSQYFDPVFVLGQRPCHGFVIGPVPITPDQATPTMEYLPENVPMEHSIADSKYLVYLASKSNHYVNAVQKSLGSHYYLGQPASHYDMLITAHTQKAENHYRNLEALVKGYESGKFIRFMKLINQWRSRIFGKS